MRMVNASLSRFIRACPNRILRLRQYGPLNLQPRSALFRAHVLTVTRHQTRTESTSTIATDAALVAELRALDEAPPRQDWLHILDDVDYGKWKSLWLDQPRLSLEADVANAGSTELLVGHPDNRNDVHLWLCILNFRMQREGFPGAAAVMEGLLARGSLVTVKKGPARAFWKAILNAAPHNEDMMQNVWAYAEWLYDRHGVRWPEFYMSVISSFMRNYRWRDGLTWHLRLAPKFGPDAEGLVNLLKRFIADRQQENQKLLRTIYLTSHHRQMYDEIIPYLSARALAAPARDWRELFIACGDLPSSSASRSFIRYLFEYYPDDHLHESELEVAGLGSKGEFGTPLELKRSIDLETPQTIYDLFNKTTGERLIPGIPESPYNDNTAAKFLMSSWVSVDFAISSLSALRVTTIGPLTFRAFALRERKCELLRQRLEQLKEGGIGIGDSSYSQALHRWIVSDNENMLKQLLHSDVHPTVFDNLRLERDFLKSSVSPENPVELTAAIRLAATADLGRTAANELLLVSLRRNDKERVLRVLDIMTSGRFKPFESTVHAISSGIVQTMSPSKRLEPVDSKYYACIFSMMLYFDLAPTSSAFRIILAHLVNDGRFEEVKYLVSDLIAHYKNQQLSGTGSVRVHKTDVPRLARKEGEDDFQSIPSDLSFESPWHPIQLMLKLSTKNQIIRRGFRSIVDPDAFERYPVKFSDGIRLLASLRDQGIIVDEGLLRDEIISCLAEVRGFLARFCPPHLRPLLRAQGRRHLILRILRNEVNNAWGAELFGDEFTNRYLTRELYKARLNHMIDTDPETVLKLQKVLDSTGPPQIRRRHQRLGIVGLLRGMARTREDKESLLRELALKVGYDPNKSPLIYDLWAGRPNIVWRGDRYTDRLYYPVQKEHPVHREWAGDLEDLESEDLMTFDVEAEGEYSLPFDEEDLEDEDEEDGWEEESEESRLH
ncbi:hypothetical protein B0T14DRAFT_551715 [Immersiella caudata]|uniref:Uncharacterized protein n=1 Tax=Immersiella caudata TaxID=314043 RepID=A0AA39X377_9PEZI|nr:hypothetical protein B0T14DRAFT_551715 [Immersiella caudata]